MQDQQKYALVTGASSGIGREIVKLLSARGWKVAALSRNAGKLQTLKEETNGKAWPLVTDLVKLNQNELQLWFAEADFPCLDVLINNAGHIINKTFADITQEELLQTYQVNILSPFRLIQQVLPLLRKSPKAHIVNIGSMGGVQGSVKFPGLSAYSSSKGSLTILTECLAEEFSGGNISINQLALGSVQTEMLSQAFPGFKAPLQPHEMAEFICWFAENGQKYFNGKTLPVALTTP